MFGRARLRHIAVVKNAVHSNGGNHAKTENTIMTTFNGGTAVQSGYYWNLGKWEIVALERHGQILPGKRDQRYLRIPLLAALMLLPIMGGLFVVFLPFIGFALTFYAAARPITRMFRRHAEGLAATVTPGWQPGEAHVTGKRTEERTEEQKGPPAQGEARLDDLQREIDEKRERR